MQTPRLTWPVSTDPAVQIYRIYRWQGKRPARPQLIMEVPHNPSIISIRVPLRLIAPGLYAFPVKPEPGSEIQVLVDGRPAQFSIDGGLVRLHETVADWQLVEAVYDILGMQVLDSPDQPGVNYVGLPLEEPTMEATLYDGKVRSLHPEKPGWVEVSWSKAVSRYDGVQYEITAVTSDGVESKPIASPSVLRSYTSALVVLVEESEDGQNWVPVATTPQNRLVCVGTRSRPQPLSNVQTDTDVNSAIGVATLRVWWDPLTDTSRLVPSYYYRLTPLAGMGQAGSPLTLSPVTISLNVTGIVVRRREGDTVPSLDGPDGITVAELPPTATEFTDRLKSNSLFTYAFYVLEDHGLASSPVAVTVQTHDIKAPDAPIIVHVRVVDSL